MVGSTYKLRGGVIRATTASTFAVPERPETSVGFLQRFTMGGALPPIPDTSLGTALRVPELFNGGWTMDSRSYWVVLAAGISLLIGRLAPLRKKFRTAAAPPAHPPPTG